MWQLIGQQQVMSNNKQSFSRLVQVLDDSGHHRLCGFLIESCSRFIEEQDWRLTSQSQRGKKTIALTTRKAAGIESQWSIKLLRQLLDVVCQLDQFQTMPDSRFLAARVKSQKIIPQGGAE